MQPNAEDYELWPISMLEAEAESAFGRDGGLLPLINISREAQARMLRIPDAGGIFEIQREQLRGILTLADSAVEQSKLSEDAMRTKSMRTGY